jgi:hypothetical protein
VPFIQARDNAGRDAGAAAFRPNHFMLFSVT